jgi:tryptophanyl-tRNA synthetase
MAADILLYQSTHVPVGHDQRQHLNLARDIAEKFNHDFAPGFFPIPEAIHNNGARIMSLFYPSSKMSKSEANPNSRINLSDENDVIVRKIKKATADTQPFPTFEQWVNAPSAAINLVNIYTEITNETVESVCEKFGGKGYGTFKPALADALISLVEPIRESIVKLLDDPAHLTRILRAGRAEAAMRANQTLMQVKDKIGFLQY